MGARIRLGVTAIAAVVIAGLTANVAPSSAGTPPAPNDGAPYIYGFVPQTLPTTGGPVRLHGTGFEGTTSITIGGVPALDFKVVDGTLITISVPPAPGGAAASNTFADVLITDNEGTGGSDGSPVSRIFYSNAVMTVTPDTGVAVGDIVRVNLTGYLPNAGLVMPQANPLVLFLEGMYPRGPFGPPQYAIVGSFVNTDANGNLLNGTTPRSVPFIISNLLEGGTRQQYDTNIQCPVNQVTADYGLDKCALILSAFGAASLERFFSFANDPVPAAPTLNLGPSAAGEGDTVELSGIHWNASPFFGSDTDQDDPGETQLIVEICDAGLTSCSEAPSDASAEMTRYFDADPNFPFPYDENHVCPDVNFPGTCVQGQFTGATLSGSMTVNGSAGCAPNCVVRVRQERYDYTLGHGTGTFIEATAPLTIVGEETHVLADFDGDGDTDVSLFRPSTGVWHVQGGAAAAFGTDGDIPVPGDYDGDGDGEFAVFRPSTGIWYVNGGPAALFGTNGDIPVPGDYDGDGDSEFAVFRPSTGIWYVNGGPATLFGTAGDVPVPGDYDDDGDFDFAVFRPSTGIWYVNGGPAAAFGTNGDIPVPGDYDGDGDFEFAVFRPSTGIWYVNGGPAAAFGTNGDIPVPGDYDGDGDFEFAVFRHSTGIWYVNGGPATLFGTAGDIPLPLPPAIRTAFF